MYVIDILWPWDDIPNGKLVGRETLAEAITAAEAVIKDFGGRYRSADIYEADDVSLKNKKLIGSLRTIK